MGRLTIAKYTDNRAGERSDDPRGRRHLGMHELQRGSPNSDWAYLI